MAHQQRRHTMANQQRRHHESLPPPPQAPRARTGGRRDRGDSAGAFLDTRPGFGSLGVPTKLSSNHYRVKFDWNVDHQFMFHYDVSIEPEPPKGMNRAIVDEAISRNKDNFNGAITAYDGSRCLYSKVELSQHIELDVEVSGDAKGRRRNSNFKVLIRSAAKLDMTLLDRYLRGEHRLYPQECVQALDVVLREASKGFIQKGKSFFDPKFGLQSIGSGLVACKGFYQSLKPAQNGMLTLNVDIAATLFYEPIHLHEFIAKAFRRDVRDLARELGRRDAQGNAMRARAKNFVKGLKIETTHNHGVKRKYKIQSLTNQPLQSLTFDMDGITTTVVDYFLHTYNYRIQFPGLPAIESGSRQKKRYLPMELCKIVPGQMYKKSLSEDQRKGLVDITCTIPNDRKGITEAIRANTVSEPLLDAFGVRVNRYLTEVPARILPSPQISYHSGTVRPEMGAGNRRHKTGKRGCKICFWSLINFSGRGLSDDAIYKFCHQLPKECENYGVQMNPRMAVEWEFGGPNDVEDVIQRLNQKCIRTHGKELELLICILPKNGSKQIYSSVKRFCEIELGLVTQCCLANQVAGGRPEYISNLLLKINTKMGGCNSLLEDDMLKRLPLISEVPSIIIGADVSHPKVGEYNSPSICAVAASMDWPNFSHYQAIVESQREKEEVCEGLFWEREDEQGQKQTGGVLKDLLASFLEKTGHKPERIIFFRDGVSEGEFEAVLNHEMEAVKKACESLGWGRRRNNQDQVMSPQKRLKENDDLPKITFIVVQKRHNTKFFPNDSKATKNGNIIPGTVVDQAICHPLHNDFYLCSHSAIKGTSRPAHYFVLRDENGFSVDDIQTLTNNLCYNYARCTRSVSIVPPVYYAHLAAARARHWVGMGGNDHVSQDSRITMTRPADAWVRPLPPIHDKIRGSMYYI